MNVHDGVAHGLKSKLTHIHALASCAPQSAISWLYSALPNRKWLTDRPSLRYPDLSSPKMADRLLASGHCLRISSPTVP